MLSNADRQKRSRERAREALRNAKTISTQAAHPSAAPLRLPHDENGQEVDLTMEEIDMIYLWDDLNRSGVQLDKLLLLVEHDTRGFLDFGWRYFAPPATQPPWKQYFRRSSPSGRRISPTRMATNSATT
jgi:hypothetical protein